MLKWLTTILILTVACTQAHAQTYSPFYAKGGLSSTLTIPGANPDGSDAILGTVVKNSANALPAANGVRTGGSDTSTDISKAQTTATGATTARTTADKFKEIVSVKDFGALGTGVGDDTTAFQNAIYAVCSGPGGATPYGSGGRVYVPPGVYIISSVKFPCNGVSLEGSNNGNVNSKGLDYRGTVIVLTTPDSTAAFTEGMVTSDYGTGIHIHNIAIDGSKMSSSATVIDYSWLQHSTVRNISAVNITNFFREEGGAANLIEDVVVLNLSGTGVEFFGDASNCGTNNTSVSLAACNKRADLLRVNRVNFNGTSNHTATCYAYHDFAQSLDVTSSICESALFGLNAYCSSAQGNNGEACPAFGRFIDYEAEDCTTCINMSDTQDLRFYGGYYLGQGKASTHVVQAYNTNYGGAGSSSATGSYAQAAGFYGSRFGNSGGSAILIGIADVSFIGNQVFSSNLSDTNNKTGAPNIEVSTVGTTTVPTRIVISSNILCEASGQQPITNTNDSSLPFIQGSVWLDSGVLNSKVYGNDYSMCANKPQDFTTSNSTNYIADF